MFPDDMTSQHLKLSDTLSYTVRNKNRPEVVEEDYRWARPSPCQITVPYQNTSPQLAWP